MVVSSFHATGVWTVGGPVGREVAVTASESELALARDLLDSDFRMVQRDGLMAAQADGVVWMLTFAGLAADDDFESVRVEADTRWRRPVAEVRAALEDRGDLDPESASGRPGDF